jgi:hypothetical protein
VVDEKKTADIMEEVATQEVALPDGDTFDVLTQTFENAFLLLEDDEFESMVVKERKRRYSEKKMQAEICSNQEQNRNKNRYEHQVVGERCWIKFLVDSSSSLISFFPGTIRA